MFNRKQANRISIEPTEKTKVVVLLFLSKPNKRIESEWIRTHRRLHIISFENFCMSSESGKCCTVLRFI